MPPIGTVAAAQRRWQAQRVANFCRVPLQLLWRLYLRKTLPLRPPGQEERAMLRLHRSPLGTEVPRRQRGCFVTRTHNLHTQVMRRKNTPKTPKGSTSNDGSTPDMFAGLDEPDLPPPPNSPAPEAITDLGEFFHTAKARFRKIRRYGSRNSIMLCCPTHDDQNPSCEVWQGEWDGKPQLRGLCPYFAVKTKQRAR